MRSGTPKRSAWFGPPACTRVTRGGTDQAFVAAPADAEPEELQRVAERGNVDACVELDREQSGRAAKGPFGEGSVERRVVHRRDIGMRSQPLAQ